MLAAPDEFDPADPCRGCGACCRTLRVSFHWLETQVPEAMTVPVGLHRVCMKGTERGDGPCIALRGDRCSIYEIRPSPCRDFPAVIDGRRNPKCLELRARIGLG